MVKQREQLNKIVDEVKELHPLLKALLPKLPRVIDLEYTHGPNEKGADFVIARQNDTFGYTEYVGIIAKIGKISQNFDDIERQIDECEMIRFFRGGKQQIQIDEVWVITTQGITNNAQEKINHKFKSRKISFVDGERLAKLIDTHLPSFWTNVEVEVGDYLAKLYMRNERAEQNASLFGIADPNFYIEQEIYMVSGSRYHEEQIGLHRRVRKVDIFREIEKQKLLLIEGSMGYGKSRLLRWITHYYTQPTVYLEKKILPIWLTYKQFIDEFDSTLANVIKHEIYESLKRVTEDAEILILVDGVDEKRLSPEEQLASLNLLASQVNSTDKVRVILTSRYLSGLDQNIISKIARYELQPLSLKHTLEILSTLCKKFDVKSRIMEDLKKSQLFKAMPRSPIAAILLAKLLNETREELPSNMTELYAKYSELILGRWDVEKGLQSEREYDALDRIMMKIAEFMIDNELHVISIEDAKTIFKQYLNSRNLKIDPDSLFEKVAKRCEMVAVDFPRNTFAFRHRTFAEYFYAKDKAKNERLLIDERAFQLYWLNVYFFYVGTLKDCSHILKELSGIQTLSNGERWLKIINMSNYLLAAYSSPYETIVECLVDAAIEAADLYRETISGKQSVLFSNLSQMHILFIIQLLMREGYGYEFFANAIEEAALKISDTQYDTQTKSYAIFFLNVAYIDIGKNESFDFLLDSLKGQLPLDLTLALKYETKNLKERSKLMRKQDSRAKKILRDNQQLISRLHNTPIKLLKSEN